MSTKLANSLGVLGALLLVLSVIVSGCAWMEAPVPPPRTAPNPGSTEDAQARMNETVDEIAGAVSSIVPGLVWKVTEGSSTLWCGKEPVDNWYRPNSKMLVSNLPITDEYWGEVSRQVKEIAARKLDARDVDEGRYATIGHILWIGGPTAGLSIRTEVVAVVGAEGGCHERDWPGSDPGRYEHDWLTETPTP